jgi:hypothetical protein
MTRCVRLGSVAVLLALAAGCFEIETRIAVTESGGGAYYQRAGLTEGMVSAIDEMEAADPTLHTREDFQAALVPPDGTTKKALKKQGVRVKTHRVVTTAKEIYTESDVRLKRFSAFPSLAALYKEGSAPSVHLSETGPNRYLLSFDGADNNGMDLGKGARDESTETEAQKAAAMSAAMTMLSEMSKMRLELSLEVPGTITSWSPREGARLEAGRVVWKLTSDSMMSLAGDGPNAADNLAFKHAEIEFVTDRPLPASALIP